MNRGWNRLLLDDGWNAENYSQLYVEIIANSSSGRPFSIDTAGVVSGNTFTPNNGRYQSASFDMNSRLLVAAQAQKFDYQVPERVAVASDKQRRSSIGSVFWLLFLLPVFWRARDCRN
jgi:hypothetical protein